MNKCYIFVSGYFKAMTAALSVAALMASSAAAQDEAQVPFKVNVAATVSAERGGTVIPMTVEANEEQTLTIPLGSVGTIWNAGGARLNAPVITASRGNINLRLPQSYKSAEIAVYSVNGRQILRGAAASEAAANISRRNVAAGTYLLSVKGMNGGAFATRLTHSGGNMNIKAVFGTEKVSSDRRFGKSAAEENWNITVSAAGYKDSSYTLKVKSGSDNAPQNITLQELTNVVAVTFNSGSAPSIQKPAGFENDVVQINGDHVVLNMPWGDTRYNVVVSGTTTNGSIKIYNQFDLTLHLNGVNITNPKGPAVNIQNPTGGGRSVAVNISGVNSLADGAVYDTPPTGEDAKGTFFSERRVTFTGGGSLEVLSKGNHAIVVDNDLFFNNANIKIPEAAKDGIHANDSIVLKGGTFDIKCKGEAIQNENLDRTKAIVISGAKVTIATTDAKSHGISSEGDVEISGTPSDSIKVSVAGDGSKGIRSRGNMRISGGDVRVNASGGRHIDNTLSPPDTSNPAAIKVEGNMTVTGGKLVLIATKSGGNGKGINVDVNLTISGGDISASADGDGIKVDGNLNITGGTTYARSATTQDVDVGEGKYTVANPSMLDGKINARTTN